MFIRPVISGATPFGLPTDIANLVLWLDGSDISTMYVNAGTQPFGIGTTNITSGSGVGVGCWADKSGNNHHMNQSNNTRDPEYFANAHNGLGVVKSPIAIAGGDPICTYATASVLSQDSEVTVFYVALAAANETLGGVYTNSLLNAAGGYKRLSCYVDSRNATRHGGIVQDSSGANTPTNPADIGTELNQFTSLISSGDFTSRLNGVAGTPITIAGDGVTPNDWTGIFVDTVNFGVEGYNPLGGDIAELLVYDAALTTTQIEQVEAYLKAKWATP